MVKITRRSFIKRAFLALVGLFCIDIFWFEQYMIQWNTFDLSKEKKDKLKVIQISDLHFDKLRSFHESIAKRINKEAPDLVFITGDSVDKPGRIDALNEFIKLIDKGIPKYAITGNWEYWGNIDLVKLEKTYAQNNCELLINQHRVLNLKNRSIAVVGIDDLVGGNANYTKAIKNMPQTDTVIVLTHCPMHRDIITKEKGSEKIDLVLSGHTHGGQIAFLGYAPFTPRGSGDYVKGWYKNHDLPTYISKGIGTSVLPFRFGARAEVVSFLI